MESSGEAWEDPPSKQVMKACADIGVEATIIDGFWDKVFPLIAQRFLTRYRDNGWIWEYIKGLAAPASPDAWRLVEHLEIEGPLLVFFARGEDPAVVRIAEADEVTQIIENCYPFEFYLTNEFAEYLVCLNHHDILIVAGSYEPSLFDVINRLNFRD